MPGLRTVATGNEQNGFCYFTILNNKVEKRHSPVSHINQFSREILCRIFQYVSLRDVSNASRVCRLWNEIMNSQDIWSKWCQHAKVPQNFLQETENDKSAYQNFHLNSCWVEGKYKEYTPEFTSQIAYSLHMRDNKGVLITYRKGNLLLGPTSCYTIWNIGKSISESSCKESSATSWAMDQDQFGIQRDTLFYFSNGKCFIDGTQYMHSSKITGISIGETKLATQDDSGICIWNRTNSEPLGYISDVYPASGSTLKINENFLIFRRNASQLEIWDVSSLEYKFSIQNQNFLEDFQDLVITYADTTIYFWSVEKQTTLMQHTFDSLFCSHDRNYGKLGLGFAGGSVAIWDLQALNLILHRNLIDNKVTCLRMLPSWKFATGSEKGQVDVWNIQGQLLYSPQKSRYRGSVLQLFSQPDRLFALFKSGVLKIWVFGHSKYKSHYHSSYTAAACNQGGQDWDYTMSD